MNVKVWPKSLHCSYGNFEKLMWSSVILGIFKVLFHSFSYTFTEELYIAFDGCIFEQVYIFLCNKVFYLLIFGKERLT